jgi:2-polyprenyl-3-methyl-5-hydroxy-6-metoxy-1,4-benzoquinol methylase
MVLPQTIAFSIEPGKLLPSTSELAAFANSMDATTRFARYPDLVPFSQEIGLPQEVLIASFELENIFHDLILAEQDPAIRRRLNVEVYAKTFELYGSTFSINVDTKSSPKDSLVALLKPELEGKSILDIGCGAGDFLLSCSRNISHGRLLGIDGFASDLCIPERNLTFLRGDIVRFKVDTLFDVVITDNVFEHITPQDVDTHLHSIRSALKQGGLAIILTPHRAFGPWDVTRIVDASYSCRVPARGTHVNEVTYSELSRKLLRFGFTNLQSIPPRTRLGLRKSPLRLPTAWFCRAERRPSLMHALQMMDKRHRYQAFEISIIATCA